MNCPTCRSNAEIPQGKIELLPVNFFVNNLISMVALHEDSEGSNLECDICESGDPPANKCTTCYNFLCEFCTQAHQRGRNTSSHSLLSLEEVKKMGSAAVAKPSLCNEHEGEVMKLFCETCEEAICRDCTIVKHRDHKYTFVKDAFPKGKESLLNILLETKTKASMLKEAVDGVLEMKKNVHTSAEKTLQKVISCFHKLSECLGARQRELIEKVAEFKKAKLKSLEIQQEELETALGSVQSSVEFTERAFENGSEIEILNMQKQMSNRLHFLNSVKWQLEPCVDDGLEFRPGNQLKQEMATFGVVSDVVTYAAMSTVTVENGQEGVMYALMCQQLVKFTIIAKERSGRKQTKGGDYISVTTELDVGADRSCLDSRKVTDCGDGTYYFWLYLTWGMGGSCQLSVNLNGDHVQGSPFLWGIPWWELQQYSPGTFSEGQIQFSKQNLIAEYRSFYVREHKARRQKPKPGGRRLPSKRDWRVVSPSDPQHPGTDRRPCVVGSYGLSYCRYMWKAQIFGNISQGFSFGVRSQSSVGTAGELGNWWVWNSGQVYKVVNGGEAIARTASTITDCVSGDIIEFYLDCEESGTLMMYNPRTKQSDTLDGVEGEVVPVFCMTSNGDRVSLKDVILVVKQLRGQQALLLTV